MCNRSCSMNRMSSQNYQKHPIAAMANFQLIENDRWYWETAIFPQRRFEVKGNKATTNLYRQHASDGGA